MWTSSLYMALLSAAYWQIALFCSTEVHELRSPLEACAPVHVTVLGNMQLCVPLASIPEPDEV